MDRHLPANLALEYDEERERGGQVYYFLDAGNC